VENASQKKVEDSACHYAITGNYSKLKGLGKKNLVICETSSEFIACRSFRRDFHIFLYPI
jgi:hypothetical protein